LKKRVAYLEENNLVKQIMQLEEENKALKMENDKLVNIYIYIYHDLNSNKLF